MLRAMAANLGKVVTSEVYEREKTLTSHGLSKQITEAASFHFSNPSIVLYKLVIHKNVDKIDFP